MSQMDTTTTDVIPLPWRKLDAHFDAAGHYGGTVVNALGTDAPSAWGTTAATNIGRVDHSDNLDIAMGQAPMSGLVSLAVDVTCTITIWVWVPPLKKWMANGATTGKSQLTFQANGCYDAFKLQPNALFYLQSSVVVPNAAINGQRVNAKYDNN